MAAAGLLIGLAHRTREPVYQGKTVSQWLEPASGPGLQGAPPAIQVGPRGAPPAIQVMGSNAVPGLISMLRCKDSTLRTKFSGWVSKHAWLKSKIKLRPPAVEMQRRGLSGVAALGPVAKAAIPDVVNLLTNQSSPLRWEALSALERIDWEPKTAVPALLEALKIPGPGLRFEAVEALNRLTGDPKAIPALIAYLDDPDLSIRETVLHSLQAFSRRPKLAAEMAKYLTNQDAAVRAEVMDSPTYLTNDPAILVPMFSVRLRDGNSFVRSMAAFHLGEMGGRATPAVPELQEVLTDPVRNVGEAATNALWEITGAGTGLAAVNEKAEISYNMPGVPLDQMMEIYEDLAGHRLVLSPNISWYTSMIRLFTLHQVTRTEAMKLIEDAVSEQTHMVLKNGHLTLAGEKSR